MKIGIPAETRSGETRVAATPETVKKLISQKHEVFVQAGAGIASSITDQAYSDVGATIVDRAMDVISNCDMILKVKEPLEPEFERMREKQAIFTYLHLAANRELTEALLRRKVQAVAYETVRVLKAAGKIGLAKGLYLFHKYRLGKPEPKTNIEHLLNK